MSDIEIQPIWAPNPAQERFLASSAQECLFGGAAGGGKSDGLLIDALGLQQNAIMFPDYKGLILRRTFPQLKEIVDRGRVLYPQIMPGAKYHEQAREFRFPTGARIELGFLESDKDKLQYQGQSFPYIGIDELTQLESVDTYLYMLSRNRSANPEIICYMRATCNPGGPGHAWVKARWGIDAMGTTTRIETINEDGNVSVREFIPARLSDNPFLSNDGKYRSNLLQMNELDRRALLEGRWDIEDAAALLINPAKVVEARARKLEEMDPRGPLIIGVDPAYKGKDGTTIICRRGRAAFNLKRYKGYDQMQLVGILVEMIKELDPRQVNIDYGYGLGVYDRLVELGYGNVCNLINFGSSPQDRDLYFNRRAEIYGRMAEWIAEDVRIPDDAALGAQLSAVPFTRDSLSRVKINSKEEIKKNLGQSPDDSDALALTFADLFNGDTGLPQHSRGRSGGTPPREYAEPRL